jgi:hypothetical protein
MVMAHSVQVSRVDPKEQAKSIPSLEAQNLRLKTRVKFLRVAWRSKTLKLRKTHGSLLIEEGSLEEANILVEEGLVHDGQLHDCVLFIEECNVTLCFHCQGYGHIAKTCKGKRTCGFCAKDHDTRGCPTSEAPSTFSCINCKGKHFTWLQLRPERAARASRASAAYKARPNKY